MSSRFLLWRAGWLVVLALAGCASGKSGLFSEANCLCEDARLIRDVSEAPADVGRELDKRPGEEYRVEPGDVLLVQPVELSSPLRLPGDQPVLPDGTIRLGGLGSLQVMNLTVEQIQRAIDARAAEKNVSDKIAVRLITRDSKVFYVLGEVNAPGSFQLKGRETVLDALLAAGGLSSNASRKNVILVRPTPPDGCRAVLPVDYVAIVQLGDTTTNYQIRAGDRVFVASKSFCEDLTHLLDKGSKHGTTAIPCHPRGGACPPCQQ
jgi:protein involved in polysaccharide export with SLBB domain